MRIEIAHSEMLHASLKEVYSAYRESGRIGVEETSGDDSPNIVFPYYQLKANPIGLPSPLKYVTMLLRSRGPVYTISVPVIVNGKATLEWLSTRFGDSFKANDKDELAWYPIEETGTGYVLKNGSAIASISSFGSTSNSSDQPRLITIGDNGAEPRKIEKDDIDFPNAITLLERIVNAYVNCIYEINDQKERMSKDLTLFLDCII